MLLGPLDIIEPDDLQTLIFKDCTPYDYEETINQFKPNLNFKKTHVFFEPVAEYSNRLFFRCISKDLKIDMICFEILNNGERNKKQQRNPQYSTINTELNVACEGRKKAIAEWKRLNQRFKKPAFYGVAFYRSKSKFYAKKPFRIDTLTPPNRRWKIELFDDSFFK